MHIGFIATEYPHQKYTKGIGGIGTFTKNLADQLIVQNHLVTVFVPSQNKTEIFEENGVEIHFIKQKVCKGFTWWVNRKYIQEYINIIISKNKIDVLEAPEWTGMTAFMKFTIPLVLRLHGSDTFFCHLERRKQKYKNKFFEKKALKNANVIVGVSEFVAAKTKELFNLNSSIRVIYNTIDVNNFTPNHSMIENKKLLYFGTLIRKKGIFELADIFNEIIAKDSMVTLVLLGRDNIDVLTNRSTLELFKEKLTNRALKQLTYVSSVPYQKVKDYIRSAEVILLPSFAEAFPMTWLEAMALEKKLVTSDIGWAKELMIDGETGFCVNPLDHEIFTNRILELLNNEEYSQEMAKNARKRIIQSFNSENSIISNIDLYKSLL